MSRFRVKNDMVRGALIQVLVKTVDHIAFNAWNKATGSADVPRTVVPWWYGAGPLNVNYDDWVLDGLLPIALGVAGKYKKSPKLRKTAKGAGLTGGALLLNLVLQNTAVSAPFLPFGTQMSTGAAAYTSTGKYGRSVSLPAMAIVAPKYARR